MAAELPKSIVVAPNVSSAHGPNVLLGAELVSLRVTPDEARAIALALWEAADEAEGLAVSSTERSPESDDEG
jgi:hypothetical protein